MPGHDDHDLERRLREQRPVARDEFVQGLAAKTRSRSHPTARPRLTLAFALSLALLVSLVAFGGVGAAKNAVSSSAKSVRSAWGDDGHKSKGGRGNDGDGSPAHHQYHGKVDICVPKVKYVVTYHWETVTKTVYKWKWQWKKHHHGHKVKVPVVITYQKKVRERVRTIVYRDKTVSQSKVPFLVSQGAVYPVPAGGCSTLDHPDTSVA
jgi:hypothetical protein